MLCFGRARLPPSRCRSSRSTSFGGKQCYVSGGRGSRRAAVGQTGQVVRREVILDFGRARLLPSRFSSSNKRRLGRSLALPTSEGTSRGVRTAQARGRRE